MLFLKYYNAVVGRISKYNTCIDVEIAKIAICLRFVVCLILHARFLDESPKGVSHETSMNRFHKAST